MKESEIRSLAIAAACCLAGIGASGCDLPQRPPLDPAEVRPAEHAQSDGPPGGDQEILEPPGHVSDRNWETWDAYFVRNQHVGYSHVVAQSIGHSAAGDIRYVLDNHLYVHRGRSRLLQRLVQTSTETPDGNLVRFESTLHVGPAVTQFEGSISDNVLGVETIRGSSRSVRKVPWQSTYRGLVALEQSLRQRPMKNKGERRALKLLLPGQYELAMARLLCSGSASVPLIDGTLSELLEINCEFQIEQNRPSYSTIWTNDQGGIVRTYSPALGLVAYRTDETTATDFPGHDRVVAAIAIDGTIDRPGEARRVAYKITLTKAAKQSRKSVDIKPVPGQYVRASSDGSFQVLVSRDVENVAKGFVASELAPTDADSQTNFFVDYNATSIQRLASAAVGSRDMTDREAAEELAQTTKRMIEDKKDPSGFSKASDVVRDMVGDNTDRAVLLAALLRARNIPSRIAVGIKYAPAQQRRMVYHAWTLAYIEGDWLHLDATDGGMAAADRLTLATTNLGGGNEYNALIPFLDVIGRIEVEVIGVQY